MRQNIFDNDQVWDWVDSNASNTSRFEFTEKLTPRDVSSVIDIGCGHGRFLKLMAEKRKEINCVAVDNSEGALRHIPFEKVQASITNVPYPDGKFDCSYALEVLEHLNPVDFSKALSELSRLSRKYIIVSTPFSEDIEANMVRCPSCFTRFHFDGHLQSFDEDKMKSLFANHEFSCVEVHRLGWSEKFKYHDLYVRLAYPNRKKQSPHFAVCPVCDHSITPQENAGEVRSPAKNGFSPISILKNSIKAIWPRERNSYWIMALYKKNS